jgi:plasmid stability protein
MGDVTLHDIDPDVLEQLVIEAKANGHSLNDELRELLEMANARRRAETRSLSAKWLRRLRRTAQSDSTELIREDRDSR